ncbi:MAG: cell wall hydrolase [Lachnospiraceae bacterium]|nr:cell wall hydrolase [Lachnospiraceae bacterium]
MKRLRGIIAYALCAVMIADGAFMTQVNVAYAATAGALDQARDDYEDTRDRIEETSGEIDDLTSEQASLQESLDALNTKLEAAADVLERLDAQIETTKTEIDLTWGKIEELSAQADMLQEKANEQYELVKAQIKYIYECGDTMYLALLRGSGTYSDYLNRNSYMEMFAEYNQTNINNLQETGKALKETQAKYEEELIKLEREKAELDEYEQAVEKQYEEIRLMVEEASGKVADYKARISNAEARLAEYESQLAAQEENIGNLEAQLDDELQKTVEAANAEWRELDNVTYDASDRKLLANLIWCEAGNEEYLGQVAVGAVVMNRVMSSVFPNTIVGVIYQGKQFSPASSGRLALALSRDSATESCYKAADAAMSGVNNIGSCLYFRTPTSKVNPKYVIGNHYFY